MDTVLAFIKTNSDAISTITAVVVAVVTGTFTVIKIITNKQSNRSNLNISDLDKPDTKRLTPLDGINAITDSKNDRTVFPQGFNMDLELSHNGRGSESITVRRIEIEVAQYEEGEKPEYETKFEGASIFGGGTASDHRFHVPVFGKEVGLATWIINAKTNQVEQAKNQDLLSADAINRQGHRVFCFDSQNNKRESLRGTLLAKTPGFYQLQIHFYISVGAKDHDYITKPIYVYAQ